MNDKMITSSAQVSRSSAWKVDSFWKLARELVFLAYAQCLEIMILTVASAVGLIFVIMIESSNKVKLKRNSRKNHYSVEL
jgi:hypothetical protein